jgi:hypothetical protein|tara:strand:+ start:121 stop:288 length:168 start_codon:yes stop_codon:yes gene_type:complete
MHANKKFKKFKNFPQLLSIIVYLNTFFALSLSLFRAAVGGGAHSLSREERFIFER